jgi:DNA-binding response OmpR family regulator
LLKELQSRWPGLRVIILTAHGTIPDAVHATQSGAFGFLTKPVDKQDLLDHVQKALKVSGFAHVDEDWRANIVTRNQLMEDKLAQANMVAGTDARVLLTGESGTGKELLATPETLLPVERLLAMVELQEVDQRLILQEENKQLREEAPRESREKLSALNRRLAVESDENARLRKALDEAQAKLEAVTHIERSINDRGTNGSHTP